MVRPPATAAGQAYQPSAKVKDWTEMMKDRIKNMAQEKQQQLVVAHDDDIGEEEDEDEDDDDMDGMLVPQVWSLSSFEVSR